MYIYIRRGPSAREALIRAARCVELPGLEGTPASCGVAEEYYAEEIYAHELAHVAVLHEMGHRLSLVPRTYLSTAIAHALSEPADAAYAATNELLAIAATTVVLARGSMLRAPPLVYLMGQAEIQSLSVAALKGAIGTALVERAAAQITRMARACYGRHMRQRPIS